MLRIETKGSFQNTERWLKRQRQTEILAILNQYAQKGVAALAAATPRDTGDTANMWYAEVSVRRGSYFVAWKNSNIVDGYPVAIMLQYGHGTGTGGYVAGQNYINPAIKPIFDEIQDSIWKVVNSG